MKRTYQPKKRKRARTPRLPSAHADEGRPPDAQAPPRQGPQAAHRLSAAARGPGLPDASRLPAWTSRCHAFPAARRARRGRLSRSAEFERAYRQGRSHGNRHLVVYAFPRGAGDDEAAARAVGVAQGRRRRRAQPRQAPAARGVRRRGARSCRRATTSSRCGAPVGPGGVCRARTAGRACAARCAEPRRAQPWRRTKVLVPRRAGADTSLTGAGSSPALPRRCKYERVHLVLPMLLLPCRSSVYRGPGAGGAARPALQTLQRTGADPPGRSPAPVHSLVFLLCPRWTRRPDSPSLCPCRSSWTC